MFPPLLTNSSTMTGTRCTCEVPGRESPLRTYFCMRTLSILFGSPDAHAACVRAREYLHLVELFIEPPELLLQPRNVQFLIAAQSARSVERWRRLGAKAVYNREHGRPRAAVYNRQHGSTAYNREHWRTTGAPAGEQSARGEHHLPPAATTGAKTSRWSLRCWRR